MTAGNLRSWFDATVLDRLMPPRKVYAHCDIPCGIYDPHEAQVAALTVLRMDQLIKEAGAPNKDTKPEEYSAWVSKVARYTAVKEQHAERVKQEVRVIWGDYFTPDLAKAQPDIHETVWKIMKQASKARQGTTQTDAEELVKLVQEFAEKFWTSKNVKTRRIPTQQKVGGEFVVPA